MAVRVPCRFLSVSLAVLLLAFAPSLEDGSPFASPLRAHAAFVSPEQQLVVDVWKEVSRQYVDTSYNGLGEEGWKRARVEAVASLAESGDSTDDAYAAIRTMLKGLGDPYTRFLTPEQYSSLTASAQGKSAGIGVELQPDSTSGLIAVVSTVPGGPASMNGGLIAGDFITAVDGRDMRGVTAELAAALIRGEVGKEVALEVLRGGGTVTTVQLRRAAVKTRPVESSIFVAKGGTTVGLLRIPSFSQETPLQVVEALRQVGPRADALALDLRGNPGGFMAAGVETAKLFLPSGSKVISEVRREGVATAVFAEGIGSETKLPVYLVVDGKTASAAEILTAALQDNKRGTVVSGGGRTFGKGRIQNVQPLEDGSGISVTRAKYVTSTGKDIHGVGIAPDIVSTTCGPKDTAAKCLEGTILLE